MKAQRLAVLEGAYAVCRLPPGAAPGPAGGRLWSLTATADEVCVVCEEVLAPPGALVDGGWACLRVAGPLPLTQAGVVASLSAPLALSGLSLFAVSTYDTDYLLVKAEGLAEAVAALRRAGHEVGSA